MRIHRNQIVRGEERPDESDMTLITPLLAKYRGKRGGLIPLLQSTQHLYGYLPPAAFPLISEATGVAQSEIYGVATFYAQFRLHPAGKHIVKVCHGTACHVQNARDVTEALVEALGVPDGGTTPDGIFTLESVACLGCCSLAPVMMIGESTYGKLTGSEAVRIVKEIRIKESREKQD